MKDRDLRRAAVGGVAWEGVSFAAGKLLMLVATIVLARLLTPEDFGVVALALVFVTYAEVITDLGVARSLVYLPRTPGRVEAALTLALVWAGSLTLLTMLAAPAIARLFGQPDIAPMVRVLSLSLLLGGIGEVPDSLLRKDLRFRRRMASGIVRAVVRGGVAVVLAAAGAGPWSIVIGHVASQLAWNFVAWPLSGARPRWPFWRLSRDVVRPMLAYGLPVAGSSLLLALVWNVDYLIVGRRLGPESLGLYTLAFRIPELLIVQALWVVGAVSFPMFALLHRDRERLGRGYLSGLRLQGAYGAAVGVAVAVSAPLMVPLLFGERWLGSVVPLQALALYAVGRALESGVTELANGVGRAGVAAGLSAVSLVVLVPTLWVTAGLSLEAVAWTHAGVTLALAVAKQAVAFRLAGLRFARFTEVLRPALAAGAGAGLAVLGTRVLVPEGWPALVLCLPAAVAGALLAVHLVDPGLLAEVRALVRRRVPSDPPAQDRPRAAVAS